MDGMVSLEQPVGLFDYVSPIDFDRACFEARCLTGVPAEHLVFSRCATIFAPVTPEVWPDGAVRRWPGVTVEAYRHPAFWLPENVAVRARSADGTWVEDDDEWLCRIAVELATRGLVDADTGAYRDMLAAIGLDVAREVDRGRVERWIADGGSDELLDEVRWPEVVDPAREDGDDWLLGTAQALVAQGLAGLPAMDAEVLLADFEDFERSGDLTEETLQGFARIAAITFDESWWDQVAEAITEQPDRLDEIATEMHEVLEAMVRGSVDPEGDWPIDVAGLESDTRSGS